MTIKPIKSVGIITKPNHAEAWQTALQLTGWLEDRGIETGKPYSESKPDKSAGFPPKSDLVVVLGGDGTMISTARLIGDADVLVLGVNYGSLGYLTEFRIEEMFPALEAILEGEYQIDD